MLISAFKHLTAAYKQADGRKIDGRRVLVDVERGRTVPNWRPRRLGGGLGTTRVGGEDVIQRYFGGGYAYYNDALTYPVKDENCLKSVKISTW